MLIFCYVSFILSFRIYFIFCSTFYLSVIVDFMFLYSFYFLFHRQITQLSEIEKLNLINLSISMLYHYLINIVEIILFIV